MPKMSILTTRILNNESGGSILCWEVFNDYLWSYMIESDMLACVLNCFRIYGDLQYKKLSKICHKYRFCPLLNQELQSGPLILCWDIFMTVYTVIFDGNWYLSICFDLLWGLWWFLGPKIVEKYAKYVNMKYWILNIQSGTSILPKEHQKVSCRIWIFTW